FSLGSTIQSQTKGIWMWCVPHPMYKDRVLVLLDTEGLGDVEKGDKKNDSKIFTLAILLSSALVYNSLGTINQDALDKLKFVGEITELIKVRTGSIPDEQATFSTYFPIFVWAVRDFNLELEIDGKTVSADGYLENALKLKTRLGELAKLYTESLNSSNVACLEETVVSLAEKENKIAIQEATKHYEKRMRTVVMPTETLKQFLDLSSRFEDEARKVFLKRSIKDKDQKFLKEFLEKVQRMRIEFNTMNEAKSREVCTALIKKHSADFERALAEGTFRTLGGHAKFKQGLKAVEEKYNCEGGKGVK
ncbi:PREDICTED: guanylate-binding protein 6-like, partial [Nanorana parkeri]|uniref:guanylate-binding protein 6-like n=1 Tax=Nanorana parkeri TaxID=125878 RepID=UPI000854728E